MKDESSCRSSTKSKMKDKSSLLTTDKVAFEREQRLFTDSAEYSNFNEVNRQQTSFNVKHSTLNVNCVATIGSFDGVHRGHQCLLRQVRSIADERGMNAVAIERGARWDSPRQISPVLVSSSTTERPNQSTPPP